MSDATLIVEAATELRAKLEHLTDRATVERILQRMHDAKRGFPTGAEPPSETTETDEDGNPTTSATRHSDRTGALATADRDTAITDLHDFLGDIHRMRTLATKADMRRQRYGQLSPDRSCVECRKTDTWTEVALGRYRDRCLFHGDAYLANDRRETPIAITQAYLRDGRKALTERFLRANPIAILDDQGNDTGRRITWRPRKPKAKT